MGKYAKYWSLVGALFASFSSALAAEPCRQALALGLDVSGSVDAAEYRLQLDGLAAALNDADVIDTLLAMPSAPVRLAVYEWSAPGDQRLIFGWEAVTDAGQLSDIANLLRSTNRAPLGVSTAIGIGLTYGANLLAGQSECWKRTLDISGDGRSNTGPRPQDVTGLPILDGITVNALVVGNGGEARGDLNGYFKSLVIHGPDAFTEQADNFEAYEEAIIRKLLRELQGLALSELSLP